MQSVRRRGEKGIAVAVKKYTKDKCKEDLSFDSKLFLLLIMSRNFYRVYGG